MPIIWELQWLQHFVETLITHFLDTGRSPNYYDAIISGDLGHVGKEIAIDIAQSQRL